jgi:hypothetical protein
MCIRSLFAAVAFLSLAPATSVAVSCDKICNGSNCDTLCNYGPLPMTCREAGICEPDPIPSRIASATESESQHAEGTVPVCSEDRQDAELSLTAER